MELHLKNCLPRAKSNLGNIVDQFLQGTSNPREIGDYLLNNLPSGSQGKLLDLFDWNHVLVRFNDLMKIHGRNLSNFQDLQDEKVSHEDDVYVVKAMLKYLNELIKLSKDKRHFLSFEEITYLLKAVDLGVVELVLELLFHICVPASSISANAHDDWIDAIEIPIASADIVLEIFHHLSLSSTEFGVVDYLRGQEPLGLSMHEGFVMTGQDQRSYQLQPIKEYSGKNIKALQEQLKMNTDDLWTTMLTERVLSGYQHPIDYREQIVRMRLYSFFILIHSKVSANDLQDYVRNGSPLVSDVVHLSDIGSEVLVSLHLTEPLRLAHIALENVLGVLESKLKRRSSVNLSSNIMEILDLVRSHHSSGGHDEAWISIVSSAISFATILTNPNLGKASSSNHISASANSSSAGLSHSSLISTCCHKSTFYTDVGKFVRLGLELFALVLTTREAQHVIADIRMIGMIVGMLKTYLQYLPNILQSYLQKDNDGQLQLLSNEIQILQLIAKVLYCLELTADKTGYLHALRECDGIPPVGQVLEVFSTFQDQTLFTLLSDCYTAGNLLETALSIIHISIQKHRHTSHLGGNIADSGHRLALQSFFTTLGTSLFQHLSSDNFLIWSEYLLVLKEVIEIEPSYLSTFINSSIATSITTALKTLRLPFQKPSSPFDVDRLYNPICRLALTVSITAEGKQYLEQSGMLEFIIEGITHDLTILPNSASLSYEKIVKLGRLISQIIMDNDNNIKSRIKFLLKTTLTELHREAKDIVQVRTLDEDIAIDSPRNIFLHKCTNICVLLEHVFSENRRQLHEMIRDIIEDALPFLFLAHSLTLPPYRQLVVQMSIRNQNLFPQFGHGLCAKSIASILKLAISTIPSVILPLIFEQLDECLADISTSKQFLRSFDRHDHISSANDEKAVANVEMDNQTTRSSERRRRRSRGSSLGQAGTNVFLLGVLDSIEDKAIIEVQTSNSNEEKDASLWKFLVGILRVEWLSIILSHALRSLHRNSTSNLLNTKAKDVLRRLFGFYRSSTLEVCRFASNRMTEKEFNSSRTSKSLIDAFGVCDLTEMVPTLQSKRAAKFLLRVIGSGGALVREGIEIEGSRIIFVADVGCEMEAFERRTNAGGLIRYRTPHGWISEFRRDQNKSPIIEILDAQGVYDGELGTELDETMYLYSIREAACMGLTRMQSALRQVSIYLSRIVSGGDSSFRGPMPTSQLSVMMSNMIKAFFDHGQQCLEPNVDKINTEVTLKSSAAVRTTPKKSSTPTKSGDEENEHEESANIDLPSICLFFGSVVKNVIMPSVDDKNGNFNILLLRSFLNNGVLKSYLEAFQMIVRLASSESQKCIQAGGKTISVLGRCAFHALPSMLIFLKRLVSREVFDKSTNNANQLVDEIGPFQIHDFLYQIINSVVEVVVPICEECQVKQFPPDIQSDWMMLLIDLLHNLRTSLPLPKDNGSTTDINDVRSSWRRGASSRSQQPPAWLRFTPNPEDSSGSSQTSTSPLAPQFVASDIIIESLTEMGFAREQVVTQMQNARTNDLTALMEMLISQSVDNLTTQPPPPSSSSVPALSQESTTVSTEDVLSNITLPPPPPHVETVTEAALPNLVSDLGMWDVPNDIHTPAGANLFGTASSSSGGQSSNSDAISLRERLRLAREESKRGGNTANVVNSSDSATSNIDSQRSKFLLEADKISCSLAKYIVEMCKEIDHLQLWETKTLDYFFHNVKDFVVKMMKKSQSFSGSDLVLSLYSAIMNCTSHNGNVGIIHTTNIYGFSLLLTLLLRDKAVAMKMGADVFGVSSCTKLLEALCNFLIKTSADFQESCWPAWYSSAFVLLNELHIHITKLRKIVSGSSRKHTAAGSSSGAVSSAASEEDEEGKQEREDLIESKESDEKTSDHVILSAAFSLLKNSRDVALDQHLSLALVQVLLSIFQNQDVVVEFVNHHGLEDLLAIRLVSSASHDYGKYLSSILKQCLQTKIEIRNEICISIVSLFKNLPSDEKSLSYDQFLKGLSTYMMKYPDDFYQACLDTVKFVKHRSSVSANSSTDGNSVEKKVGEVKVILNPNYNNSFRDYEGVEDMRALHCLRVLLSKIAQDLQKSDFKDVCLFATSDCLNSLSDAMLELIRAPALFSMLLNQQSSGQDNIVGQLLETVFIQKETVAGKLSPLANELTWASSRFFLALAAYRGLTRTTVLSAVLQALKTIVQSNMSVSNNALHESMIKCCNLLVLLSQSSKDMATKTNEKKKEQGVSLDSVEFLVNKGLVNLLIEGWLKIEVDSELGGSSIVAIVELLELISRPKLLESLENQRNNKAVDESAIGKDASGMDSNLRSGAETMIDVMNSSEPQAIEANPAIFHASTNNPHHLEGDEDEEDDEDQEDEIEEEEDDEEGEDEDEDEEEDMDDDDQDDEEDDEEEEDDDDEGPDEDDNGDGDDHDDGNERVRTNGTDISAEQILTNIMDQIGVDSFNSDDFIQVESGVGHNSRSARQGSSRNRQTEDFELVDGSVSSEFTTPNDVRVLGIHALLRSMQAGDNTLESSEYVMEVLRRLQVDHPTVDVVAGVANNPSINSSSTSNQLLPGGLRSALQVSHSEVVHPMLDETVIIRPADHAQLTRAHHAHNMMGSMRANINGLHPSAGILDFSSAMIEDFDPMTLPAVWPRSANRTSTSATSASPSNLTYDESTFEEIMQEMQQRMEQHVIEEVEDVEGEEMNEEASHSTITFASRGVSQSIQSSMQAVQDPNPRHTEDDSVRGGSIPPMIEIESHDQEGNEEMSVLTLPQEESTSLAFNLEGTTFHSQNAEEGSTMSPIDEGSDTVSGIYDESHYEDNNDDISQLNSIGSLSIRNDILLQEAESVNSAGVVESVEAEPLTASALEPEPSQQPSEQLNCPPGYDIAVFNSLPPEMQLEVIEQHGETSDNMRELIDASGFDYETIMSLPDDIRQEVLDQARRQLRLTNPDHGNTSSTPAATAQSTEHENVAFLASLSLELRAEVLLTADADFLATLPAEIATEAQNLREQAASNWQRREIVDRVAGPMLGRLPVDVPSPSGGHESPDDEEYDSENSDNPDYDSDDPFTGRVPRIAATARHRPPTDENRKKDRNGLMSIPKEKETSSTFFPPQTLVAITRSLLSSKKHPREYADLLLKAIVNVCHSSDMKVSLVKLLTGCFVQDKSMVEGVMHKLSSGKLTVTDLLQGVSSAGISSDNAKNKLTLKKTGNQDVAMNSVALYRLLHILSNLCSSHPGFVYSFLANPERSSVDPTSNVSHSLLEVLFQAFPVFIASGKVREMEMTTSLIEQITAPLDLLPEQFAPIAEITEEMKAKDEKQQSLTIPVPQVQLTQESLSQLCDVLLSDACNHKVFISITTTISRLAKIRTNNFYLLELLNDVIVDLAEQSKWKLNEFGEYLTSIHAEQAAAVSKGGEESNGAEQKISAPLIPLGEYGSKQYERLLRLLQTLQSMFEKSQSSFTDITNVENLVEVWQMLDMVLSKLRVYLVEDEDSNGEAAMQKSNPQQTVLVSILRRLQPAIEAFFLLHTLDLLHEKEGINADGDKKDSSNADTSVASSKPPGHRYRLHREYQRANINLMADTASSTELRRQVSFTHVSSMSKVSSLLSGKNQKLIGFVQQHRGLLNALIKSKPSLLNEGPFASLLRIVQLRPLISFENKRKYFYHRLKKIQQIHATRRSIALQVRRNQVFEDSFHQLRSRKAEDLRGRLQINFYGEEGIDAGGLTREWFVILSRDIFNPNYALFMAAADGATFQPNPLSVINSNHLDYFKFVGRIIGKALCDGQLMDAHFTRSFYKHVLGLPIEFADIESTEPDYYKSLKMMLENPLEMLGMSGMTFTAEIQKFGRVEDIDLIPNGSQILVTDDNKHEYVRLVAQHRMTTAINAQIDSFLCGFYELIPAELICIFTPAEVELLICGLPDVNIDELHMNTEYQQYRATDDNIVWFWEALRGFNREQRAAFLQFVTGTSKVPLGGFANLQGMRGTQRFSIHKAYGGETGLLPSAHTCYNQLDLPVYKSAEELREKLLMAIQEGSEGFGFA